MNENDAPDSTLERETGWSRELLYQLFDNVRDFAIFATDPGGRVVSWNVGAENLFGYAPEEIIGKHVSIVFTPEDRLRDIPAKEMLTALAAGVAEDERWHLRRDGTRFYASGLQTPLYTRAGRHTGFAKIARDLTERTVAQQQLRDALDTVETRVRERTNELAESNESLRLEVAERKESERLRAALIRRIVKTQEDERKRIAREIHDHVGQQMTGLQLNLQSLIDDFRADATLARRLANLQSIATRIDLEVDFLAWELRPSVVDELGVAAAAEEFVRDWSAHFGVPAGYRTSGLGRGRLLPEIEINLYRVLQESLHNVGKHAGARSVSVELQHRAGAVALIVEDDGAGFDPAERIHLTGSDRGMGLLGMEERAELLGGTLEIESRAGAGTTVYFRAPARFEETSVG